MADFEDLRLDDFDGRVRLFPLPVVSLYPSVIQPFHIFEPRYREMLEAALEGDGLIGMAVLAGGWEDAEEPLPLERPLCVGRVVSHTKLPDGRSNILMLGVRRGVIQRELPQRESFREAEVEVYEDMYPVEGVGTRAMLQGPSYEAVPSIVAAISVCCADADRQSYFRRRDTGLADRCDFIRAASAARNRS